MINNPSPLYTASETMPKRLSDVVKRTYEYDYSKDEAIMPVGTGPYNLGLVLGTVTATDEVKPRDPSATDGSEVASGVCLSMGDATTEPQRILVLRRAAIVVRSGLEFAASNTAADIETAIKELNERGIVTRYEI